ncbi:MAG: hypothetical protein EBR33_07800 [Synechococcaceae bacterium WB4_1_0192]|jgi:uncharacterized membrane protein|nr:hypothetical protein [Synechococcaceae bacterium WB4_1_0192]
MAAPSAYEQPTLNRAWEALLAHVPTLILIWIAGGVLYGLSVVVNMVITLMGMGIATDSTGTALAQILGYLASLPFAVLSSLVGVLFIAVPALYYETGEVITVQGAFAALMRRPMRYLLAGILFTLVMSLGYLFCILPGIAVALVMPVYVNRVFATDQSIVDALGASFQAVYRSPHGMSFVGIQILAGLVGGIIALCTCGLGALVVVPMLTFYIQNVAYNKGVIS